MEHLQIAYDLLVIMIGLAALSIVVFWAVRTGEADLRDFSILYACFTLVLVVVMLKKYLSLNVEDYSARAWYWLSGAEQVLSFAVIVAGIHFFTGVYRVRTGRAITIALPGDDARLHPVALLAHRRRCSMPTPGPSTLGSRSRSPP